MAQASDSPSGTSAKPNNFNLPNAITVLRILLAPVFFWMLLADGGQDGSLRYGAAILFIVAIGTDGIDGYIARRYNLVTDLGKLLDPIADKVLTGAALIGLSILGELWWWVTIVILVRELGITVYRFIVLRDRVVPASRGGKLKTLVQSFAISFALLPLWVPLGDWVFWFNWVLMAAALVITVWTGIDYLVQAVRVGRRNPRRGA